MHQRTKIAIIGGSGNLGSVVTNHFLAQPMSFEVIFITREGSKIQNLYPDIQCRTVKDYTGDISGLITALHGVEVLLSFLNGQAATAASQAGVRLFISSEYTLDVLHPATVAAATQYPGVMRSRLESAKELSAIAKEKQIRTRCLTICTAAFLDLDLLNGVIRFDLNARTAVLVDGGNHKATGCSMKYIARALEWICRQEDKIWPAERYNRVHIAEVEYTAGQLMERLEALSGNKWTAKHVTSQDLQDGADKAAAERQGLMLYINQVLRLNFNGSGSAYFPDGFTFDNREIPRDDLDTILKDVLKQHEGNQAMVA